MLLVFFFLTHAVIYLQVANILPSKMILTVGWGASGKCTRSKPAASFEVQSISCTERMCSNNKTYEKVSKPMLCLDLSFPPCTLSMLSCQNQRLQEILSISSTSQLNKIQTENLVTLATGTTSASTEMQRY